MDRDEQEIRKLVADWMELTKQGNVSAVLELMAEDAVFLAAGQPPMVGRAVYAAAAKPQSNANAARPKFEGSSEIREIKVFGDWAYLWTRLKVVVTPPGGGPSMTRAGNTLTILRKEAGKWLLARDANMLAPVPGNGK